MQGRASIKFLRNPNCHALIISRKPLLCEGLQVLMAEQSEAASLYCESDFSLLAPESLECIDMVIVELGDSVAGIYQECCIINKLQNQFDHLQWIFIVPPCLADIAIEKVFNAQSFLLSVSEPINNLINYIFNGGGGLGYISALLLREKSAFLTHDKAEVHLTFAERRVLRLLSKGWRINQIATLLEKNSKTISAQKSSALGRLGLNNDAEMYAWMASDSGIRTLNRSFFLQGMEKGIAPNAQAVPGGDT